MHVCNRYTQSMSLSENIFGVKPLDACRRSRDGGIVSSNSGSLTTSSIDNASKQTSKTLKNKHTGTMKKKVVDRNNTSTTATNITYVTTPSGVKSASNRADGQAGPSSAAITKKIVIRKNVATSLVPTVAASTAGSSDSFDALDMSALLRQTILVRIMLAKRTKEESLIIDDEILRAWQLVYDAEEEANNLTIRATLASKLLAIHSTLLERYNRHQHQQLEL